MQKHLLLHARQVSLVCTHTHAHPRREFDFLLSHKLSLYPRHDTIFLKGAHEWGRTPDGKIYELIHALLQSSPAVSHLIRGPEDITVYLPVLPCTRVSTCLPAGLPLTLCVYFGYFQGGVVRSWKCETVSWQADQNCWRAWQEKGSIVWPGVHRGVRGEGEEPKTGIERKEDSEKKRKCGWQISVWGTRLFRRQDGGWSSMMMNHDGSTQHSAQYLLGAALTRAEWRGGGNSPRLLVDTEPRWREDTWGICLFISSHMLYPLQCYSESAQWGIRWTLHQLSEDGRAFLPQEQLTQTRSIESGPLEGFGWEQSFFGISLQASRLVLLFVFFFLPAVEELSPQCREWIKTHKKK